MLAPSLFLLLILAKILSLPAAVLGIVPLIAWFWQDVFIAALFALFEGCTKSKFLLRLLYVGVIAYTSLNLAVVQVLSTPLTWTMLRATDSAIGDSIAMYLSWEVLGPSLLFILLTPLVYFWTRKWKTISARVALALALMVFVLGPSATRSVHSRGLHRNAVFTLFDSLLARAPKRITMRVVRLRDTNEGELGVDLSHLRGKAKGRNLVLVFLESTAAKYLRPWGAKEDPMPFLSRLSKQALLFMNSYAVYPESIRTLLAIQNSRYPALRGGVEDYEGDSASALPGILAKNGYRTALFHSGRFDYLGMKSVIRNAGYDHLADAGRIGGAVDSSFGVGEGPTVDAMLSWIDETSMQFMLSYLPIAGHHPYDSPDIGPFEGDKVIDAYRNALHYADTALERLVTGLRERKLWQNSVILLIGDHGEAFGQHAGNFGHSFFLYEENVHVPFLLLAPGLIKKGQAIARIVSHVDVAPTVLDLFGIAAPSSFEGLSLLEPRRSKALFLTDYSLSIVGLRDGPWKFLHELDSGQTELYRLDRDPQETTDLSAANAGRVSSYRSCLRSWLTGKR